MSVHLNIQTYKYSIVQTLKYVDTLVFVRLNTQIFNA